MQSGVWGELNAVLRPVLLRLWEMGYVQGLTISGRTVAVAAVRTAVGQLAGQWLNQILRTTVSLIAKALIAGVAIGAFLADAKRAHVIAVTEINRAISQAVMDDFAAQGVTLIRWVCFPGCCDECEANAEKSKNGWQLGVPFPSGAMCPPQHPNCRCHIEEA